MIDWCCWMLFLWWGYLALTLNFQALDKTQCSACWRRPVLVFTLDPGQFNNETTGALSLQVQYAHLKGRLLQKNNIQRNNIVSTSSRLVTETCKDFYLSSYLCEIVKTRVRLVKNSSNSHGYRSNPSIKSFLRILIVMHLKVIFSFTGSLILYAPPCSREE